MEALSMIKQWMAAHRITFSVLVFSLTMAANYSSFAQDYEEDQTVAPALDADEVVEEQQVAPTPAVRNREAQRINVQGGNAAQSSLATQPVVVTSSMSPAQVPQALPANTYAEQRGIGQTSSMPQGM